MKRFLALVLIIIMIMSFTGCGLTDKWIADIHREMKGTWYFVTLMGERALTGPGFVFDGQGNAYSIDENNQKQKSGTYVIDKYTITLTYEDGTVQDFEYKYTDEYVSVEKIFRFKTMDKDWWNLYKFSE